MSRLFVLVFMASIVACDRSGGLPPPLAFEPGVARNPASSGVPTHVMTMDYYDSGSEKAGVALAARYLTWGETQPRDQAALDAAGIKTLFYLDPTFQMTDGPLYDSNESTFSHSCSGARIRRKDVKKPFYLMSRNTAEALLTQIFLHKFLAQYPFDGTYEDSAGGLVTSRLSAKPCHWQLRPWIKLDAALQQVVDQPMVASALDGYRKDRNGVWENNQESVHLALQPQMIGGATEQCYSNQSNRFVLFISGTLWNATENTEIELLGHHKLLFCLPVLPVPGASKAGLLYRMYDYASFPLTYEPDYAVFWEEYTTPSNFHIYPETGLVPLDPVAAQPTDISQLDSGGAYLREYATCYYRGTLVGRCAALVNPSYYVTINNPLYGKYDRSLVLHGAGVLDGGTVTFNGPAAPKTLMPHCAYIVFP